MKEYIELALFFHHILSGPNHIKLFLKCVSLGHSSDLSRHLLVRHLNLSLSSSRIREEKFCGDVFRVLSDLAAVQLLPLRTIAQLFKYLIVADFMFICLTF